MAIIILLCFSLLYFFVQKQNTPPPKQKTTLEDINSAREAIDSGANAVVPTSNPLQKITPKIDPIKKTNPFQNDYQNPFE